MNKIQLTHEHPKRSPDGEDMCEKNTGGDGTAHGPTQADGDVGQPNSAMGRPRHARGPHARAPKPAWVSRSAIDRVLYRSSQTAHELITSDDWDVNAQSDSWQCSWSQSNDLKDVKI